MRTLVVHTGGIGDFLLACPAIAQAATGGPVELLGNPSRLELAVAGGIAAAAHSLDSVAFDSVFGEPRPVLRTFLARFTRVFVFMRDEGGAIAGTVRECGVADARAFPGVPPDTWSEYASAYYAQCLDVALPEAFHLALPPAPESSHDVLIHPGSGGRRKNWPMENFCALADMLRADGRHVTWCLGPAEVDWSAPAGDVLREESLVRLGRHFAAARLYIGNDSGMTHLAAMAGAPTLAIFGPTDPAVWGPVGPHVCVLHRDPWPEVDDVARALGMR